MQKTAIIIGAGIAGMNLAQKMARQGAEVTLIEATGKLGGRCRSVKDNITGQTIDNGQHLMMGAYKEFLSFLNNLGTLHKIQPMRGWDMLFYNLSGDNYRLFDYNIHGRVGFIFAIMKLNILTFSDKIKFIKLATKINFINPDKLTCTASEFLLRNRQSANLMKYLWNPLILAVLNAPPSQAPASLLVRVMKLSFLGSGYSSKMLYMSGNYDDLFYPLNQISEKNNLKILYNTPVREIFFKEGKAAGIITKSGEVMQADYIISAVPFHQLIKILPDEIVLNSPLRYLHYYTSNTIISAYIWYKEEIDMPIYAAVIASPIHWIFNKNKMNNASDTKYKTCISITISDAANMNHLSNQEVSEIILEELTKINKDFSKYSPQNIAVFKEKRATFAANCNLEKVRINQTTQFHNFYICGDWTNTKYPATIEGAAKSAETVFKRLIKDLI